MKVDPSIQSGWLVAAALAVGCNAVFGLDAGKSRPSVSAGRGGSSGSSGNSGRGGGSSGSDSVGGGSGEGGEDSSGGRGSGGRSGNGGSTAGSSGSGGTGGSAGGKAGSGGAGGASGASGDGGTIAIGGEGGQETDPRPTASVWAMWKMPNPAGSDLPNEASYDTSTPGVVLDEVTKLMWERETTTPLTWDAAVAYCADLELAGFDDFRMPSRIELVSIVDFTVGPPTIDPVAFPDTPQNVFWTTSPWPSDPASVYIVHFIAGYTSVSTKQTTLPVRCVR